MITTEATQPEVIIAPNDRGGHSMLVPTLLSTVPVGNYATQEDARRAARRAGLKPIDAYTRADFSGSYTDDEADALITARQERQSL
jgi:hypothetical protein